jgi:hypothetical protein
MRTGIRFVVVPNFKGAYMVQDAYTGMFPDPDPISTKETADKICEGYNQLWRDGKIFGNVDRYDNEYR